MTAAGNWFVWIYVADQRLRQYFASDSRPPRCNFSAVAWDHGARLRFRVTLSNCCGRVRGNLTPPRNQWWTLSDAELRGWGGWWAVLQRSILTKVFAPPFLWPPTALAGSWIPLNPAGHCPQPPSCVVHRWGESEGAAEESNVLRAAPGSGTRACPSPGKLGV